ncbi:hypothetical protein N7468_003898 [Penicillium chermesinum]|uniref:Uncharacterized protein n=1 Tax=Penicillium chermesinum TaxID=63820 RepID=A0A9W9P7J6_9EURO|nr:uncharacterized protein N7468_003898 [Penicillium chermesinum]KAJ5239279.1 hypothetical protein N7468_003898 [Penicillium chermesinum]
MMFDPGTRLFYHMANKAPSKDLAFEPVNLTKGSAKPKAKSEASEPFFPLPAPRNDLCTVCIELLAPECVLERKETEGYAVCNSCETRYRLPELNDDKSEDTGIDFDTESPLSEHQSSATLAGGSSNLFIGSAM